jgi:hypothetical protein
MDRLKKLIRESLVAHLNEADSKKKDDIIVPEGCFGGPKHHIGALVNIVELLMNEKDENGRRAVDDLKQFLKGIPPTKFLAHLKPSKTIDLLYLNV